MIFTIESKFEIGDKVVVHNAGLHYPSCDELANELKLDKYKRNEGLIKHNKAVIISMVFWRGSVICGIKTNGDSEFAINEVGLKLITNK